MAYFYPNDGRPPKQISSVKDIKEYMGDSLDDFGPITVDDNNVLTSHHGQYICIGVIK